MLDTTPCAAWRATFTVTPAPVGCGSLRKLRGGQIPRREEDASRDGTSGTDDRAPVKGARAVKKGATEKLTLDPEKTVRVLEHRVAEVHDHIWLVSFMLWIMT